MATKKITFHAWHLTEETFLMLTFEPPVSTHLYRDQFPVVWKVIRFPGTGEEHCSVSITYSSRLAFGLSTVEHGHLVDAQVWVDVEPGDSLDIIREDDETHFGPIKNRKDTDMVSCRNETGARVDLSLGFVKGEGYSEKFEPIVLWRRLGHGSRAQAEFNPVIKAYVTTDYQKTQVLTSEIDTDCIWSQSADALDVHSTWNFGEDEETGAFSIGPPGIPPRKRRH